MAQSHQAQGAGPKAPGDVDDLWATGGLGGEAWQGHHPAGAGAQGHSWQECGSPPPPPGPAGEGPPGGAAGGRERTHTGCPPGGTCSPRLVRVDFMRMKKERSWAREK